MLSAARSAFQHVPRTRRPVTEDDFGTHAVGGSSASSDLFTKKALARRPEDRWQRAAEFRDAIDAAMPRVEMAAFARWLQTWRETIAPDGAHP